MGKVKTLSNTIPGFTALTPSIYEHEPSFAYEPSCSPKKNTDAPSLILLCSWTGANSRHVAKYTAEYQKLFPFTRIMIITTTAKDLCLRHSKGKQERLRPAVERISSPGYVITSANDAGILMHVFSEGGSNKACELAEAYYTTTGERLPVSALCLDSTPGHPRYLHLCNALNKSIPQIPVLRHTDLVFGSAVLGAIWVTYCCVKGFEKNVITRTRRRLLDDIHWDLATSRCYLYSKENALIAWQDVNEHVCESMKMGIPTREVLFEGAGTLGMQGKTRNGIGVQ
ncbi:uncharacterized protein ALTATR162_LOCUS5030 [Alternaria atra]|uniref:Uncharacterized protein n=1 Tax=Alternaria atra TaxID=119953 RepID=A0A8J2MZM7_9PLEO|nr:uncharacterized protein ALTATR162_LOCUS5030 [Alternaria atra]CAG5158192.1 unnamed protein product [Alternaria atra]